MYDSYIGSIILVAFGWAPQDWMPCDGRLLSIAQYQALYSLIGTTYGGNGVNIFGIPDLRGRVPMSHGNMPGGSNFNLGQVGGQANLMLTQANMPTHTHSMLAVTEPGTTSAPTGAFLANTGSLDKEYSTGGTMTPMNHAAIGVAGQNQPFSIMQPYLALNYCICVNGMYPSRP